MSLANRFRSGRVPHQHIGISSFTEDKLVLDVIGNTQISGTLTVGVGTNNSGNGNISIGGTTGDVGQYLRSTGVGIEWADFADVRDSQVTVATAGQTTFLFTANELNQYNPSFIDVYVNGVRLTASEYDASNGSNVVLYSACFAGDIVELISYNTNNITNGMGGSTIGINTLATSTLTHVNASGVITATSFYGDGSNLTNLALASNAAYANVSGIATVAQNLTGVPDIEIRNLEVGIATFTGDLNGTNASFSGNVSIGGTLTYEDVKNIDSVGIITARDGIDVTGVIKGFTHTSAPHSNSVQTIVVKVEDKTSNHRYYNQGSTKGYTFDGEESPFLNLTPGKTYKFDQADNSNLTHQFAFYLDKDKQRNYSGGEITVAGTAGSPGSYTQITPGDNTPTVLYYQCVNHSYMGSSIQFNTRTADTLGLDSSVNTTGIITASRYYGDGTYLSGVQSQLVIQEEGSPVGTAGTINFVGAGITATVSTDIATITVGNHFSSIAGVATVAQGLTGSPNIAVSGLTGAGAQFSGLCTAGTFVGNVVGSVQGGNWAGYNSVASNNVSAAQSVTAGNGFYGDGSNLSNLVTTSDNAPSSPADGSLWWKSDEGVLKIYYQDIDSSQWVDASPGGGGSGSGGSSDLLNDDTPKLGGNLDLNNRNIRGTGNVTIAGIGSFTGTLQVNDTSHLNAVDVTGIATFNDDVKLRDGNKLGFGTDSDLLIYHDSTDSYIKQQASGTGDLIINSDNLYLRTSNNGQVHGQFIKDGEAILNYGTVKKFETTNSGVQVSGGITATTFHGDGQYLTNIYSAPPQGISTTGFTGLVDLRCLGYLEVDGQSILDDVIVSAAATFQGALSANTGPVTLNNATINGNSNVTGIATFGGSITINDTVDLNSDIDVDGHTELDNVNVSGVVTSTSFVGPLTGNVDGTSTLAQGLTGTPSVSVSSVSAGIITATNGYYGNVNVNNQNIELGNCTTAGSDNTIKVGTSALEIHHRPSAFATYLQNKADTNLFLAGNDTNGTWGNIFIRPYLSNFSGIACWWGGSTELYYGNNNSKKLETTSGGVVITGSLSKSGGTFKIPHPVAGLSTTKHLVHSFLEGPQMDLIYRGKIDLVGGTATVNIDTKAGMTEGTFVLLNRDVQCFTSNETGWTAVKGSVSGNILTITAQDNSCTDTISWMVVGERQDDTVKSLDMTDSEGNLIVEPDQPTADTKHADVQAQL